MLALLVPLLFLVTLGTFLLLRLGGQDLSATMAGPTATGGNEIARLRADYGLDRPLPIQFAMWLEPHAAVAIWSHGDPGFPAGRCWRN